MLSNVNFTKNSANQGGSIYASSSTLAIINVSCSYSTAQIGACLRLVSSVVSIKDSVIESNSAQTGGGAIHMVGGSIQVQKTQFLNNSANSGVGAIAVFSGESIYSFKY